MTFGSKTSRVSFFPPRLSLFGWFVNLTKGEDYSHLNSSSRAYRSRFSSSRYYEACHIVTRGKFSTGTWNPRTSSSTSEENSNWLISVRGAGMEFLVQGRIKDKEHFLLWMWGEKKKINKKNGAVYADVMPSLLCKQSSCLFMSAVGGQVLQGPSLSRPKPTPMRWSLSGTGLPMSCWDPQSTPHRSTCGTSLCKTPHPLS